MTGEQSKKQTGEKILVCTICSRKKNRAEGLLPALQRYHSQRIRTIFSLARKEGLSFAILSGKFGLIGPEKPIPYYDKLLAEEDVGVISSQIVSFLSRNVIKKVIFLLPNPARDPRVAPYIESMRQAIKNTDIGLDIRYVPLYPKKIEISSKQ